MTDSTTAIAELKALVQRFATERQWEPYHSPKNLVMALAVEVAELMEPFMWVDAEASRRMAVEDQHRPHLAEELADVFILVLNLSLSMSMDLSEIVRAKLVRNAEKYPATLAE
jgi:NTP pyrophosphatase (non-canonical NTP hydrolase)